MTEIVDDLKAQKVDKKKLAKEIKQLDGQIQKLMQEMKTMKGTVNVLVMTTKKLVTPTKKKDTKKSQKNAKQPVGNFSKKQEELLQDMVRVTKSTDLTQKTISEHIKKQNTQIAVLTKALSAIKSDNRKYIDNAIKKLESQIKKRK